MLALKLVTDESICIGDHVRLSANPGGGMIVECPMNTQILIGDDIAVVVRPNRKVGIQTPKVVVRKEREAAACER